MNIGERTKHQELISALTHGCALVLAVIATVVLIVLAVVGKSPWYVVGYSIYGVSLILLYGASFIYHLVNSVHRFSTSLQKIDHSMIYILIAGSYTPICIIALRGAWGWTIVSVIWCMAIFGIISKMLQRLLRGWVSAVYYLAMGWLAMVAFAPLLNVLGVRAFFWLVLGGIFYSVGVIFFSLEKKVALSRYVGMHELFHIFVILGSMSHFWLIYRYL